MAAEWLAEFSRQYYVPLLDYGPGRGDRLLIGSGCGIMLGVMDVCPAFRWCVDIDTIRNVSRFGRWLAWAENFVGGVGVVGWFSITDPGLLRAAIVYAPFTDLGGLRFGELDQFIRHIEQAQGAGLVERRDGDRRDQLPAEFAGGDGTAGQARIRPAGVDAPDSVYHAQRDRSRQKLIG
jgi:hypothetical protein